MKTKEDIIQLLEEKQILEHGNFTLKSGEKSSVYVDLRKIIGYPSLLRNICLHILPLLPQDNSFSLLGVPIGGYSFAQISAYLKNAPCLFLRKEAKQHGKKQLLEGIWEKGTKIVLIDDVITSGTSLLETIETLENLGCTITKVIVVLKRKEDGIQKIWDKKKIQVETLFTLKDLQEPAATGTMTIANRPPETYYRELRNKIKSHFAQKFLDIVIEKKTNIILSADLTDCNEILSLVQTCGPHICALKLHLDIISNISQKFIENLTTLAHQYNFFIIEDRKFADIGNTVALQLENHPQNLLHWIDAVTVHSLPGAPILDAFKKHNLPVLFIQEMSSEENLFNSQYIKETLKITTKSENRNIILGLIGQQKYTQDFLLFTPGIHLTDNSDNLGQKYKNPEEAIKKGTDIFIIGRGIYKSSNPLEKIITYKNKCWKNVF